ncbi:hypothetical protein Sgly_1056 [Syntrophobotulus glycolicus DSM 8271]|uniref:DUF1273 family protein n=1 Tax=Syntrophobotulus glycolicus (strain DSM 8271 / FlGlyR) TaxID=645991 RepID=F0STU4_SYNGF|nr:SLOG family protein [Syntrophobotulus glycolicus]ADY55384.1 hypothetical protein Sgly_1056 [Syntrophobotulus glycolicus DSM 8271]
MPAPKTCGFTGYRPAKLPFRDNEHSIPCVHLKLLLYTETEAAVKDGYTRFICGFALGSDTYFAEAVIALRERYPEITLEAALPCETQANRWLDRPLPSMAPRHSSIHGRHGDRDRYFSLLAQCDKETCISRNYHKGCYLERNRYIVRQSQRLIAVFDGQPGGTMFTVNRAKARELELAVINPRTFRIERNFQKSGHCL